MSKRIAKKKRPAEPKQFEIFDTEGFSNAICPGHYIGQSDGELRKVVAVIHRRGQAQAQVLVSRTSVTERQLSDLAEPRNLVPDTK